MGREEKPMEPQKPQIEPGKPLRPDPGYPETRGGTRQVDPKKARTSEERLSR